MGHARDAGQGRDPIDEAHGRDAVHQAETSADTCDEGGPWRERVVGDGNGSHWKRPPIGDTTTGCRGSARGDPPFERLFGQRLYPSSFFHIA